jgi:ankyrin repeat protein
MSKWRIVLAVCCLTGVCFAGSARDLQLAARSGDLKEVRRLVASGVPVDSADAYGPTALSLAAGQGRLEVVRYLLEKGADPDARETFFGMSVLDVALWKGEPDFTVAKMLLEAGAKNRAGALSQAFESGNVDLARVAAKSGPVL